MAKDPIKALEAIEKGLDRKVGRVLNDMAFKIKKRVDSQEFLKWKSRRKPIVVEKAKLVGDLMTVTVRGASKWKWGHVHIGPPGSTTIKAAKGMLAIPTDFARKAIRGRTMGPKQYAGTRIFAGIVWGKAGWGEARTGGGLRQRRAAGEKFIKETLIPLFILKQSVVIKRRIDPKVDIVQWARPVLTQELKKAGLLKVG